MKRNRLITVSMMLVLTMLLSICLIACKPAPVPETNSYDVKGVTARQYYEEMSDLLRDKKTFSFEKCTKSRDVIASKTTKIVAENSILVKEQSIGSDTYKGIIMQDKNATVFEKIKGKESYAVINNYEKQFKEIKDSLYDEMSRFLLSKMETSVVTDEVNNRFVVTQDNIAMILIPYKNGYDSQLITYDGEVISDTLTTNLTIGDVPEIALPQGFVLKQEAVGNSSVVFDNFKEADINVPDFYKKEDGSLVDKTNAIDTYNFVLNKIETSQNFTYTEKNQRTSSRTYFNKDKFYAETSKKDNSNILYGKYANNVFTLYGKENPFDEYKKKVVEENAQEIVDYYVGNLVNSLKEQLNQKIASETWEGDPENPGSFFAEGMSNLKRLDFTASGFIYKELNFAGEAEEEIEVKNVTNTVVPNEPTKAYTKPEKLFNQKDVKATISKMIEIMSGNNTFKLTGAYFGNDFVSDGLNLVTYDEYGLVNYSYTKDGYKKVESELDYSDAFLGKERFTVNKAEELRLDLRYLKELLKEEWTLVIEEGGETEYETRHDNIPFEIIIKDSSVNIVQGGSDFITLDFVNRVSFDGRLAQETKK